MKKRIIASVFFSLLFILNLHNLHATLITFDDAPTGPFPNNPGTSPFNAVIINDRYANLGVTFSCYSCVGENGGAMGTDVYAIYSPNYNSSFPNNISVSSVLWGVSSGIEAGVFDISMGYIKASFSSLQREISIDAIITGDGLAPGRPLTGGPFMEAFDSSGNLLSLAQYPFGCSFHYNCPFTYNLEIEQSTPDISYVLLSSGTFQNSANGLIITGGNAPYSAFDNLSFSVPEPSTFILFVLGLVGLFGFYRKKNIVSQK